jgi:hypothetical protein
MDFERIAMLLDVVHKAAGAGPAYAFFGDAAWAELRKIREDATVSSTAETKSDLFGKPRFSTKGAVNE